MFLHHRYIRHRVSFVDVCQQHQADVSHASAVTGNVREFAGEFSVYGFFEADETNVYRGPAGSSSEDKDGRSLKSGLFSIFF